MARQVARWELDGIDGAVVVVDVIRACDPADIELAAVVDAFDFAMEVERTQLGLRLTARRSP